MKRDVEQLKQNEFDVLIVGGGIYGCWAARHAAVGGLKVAIVEAGDWGCATSSASSKLLHGGLRYLEQFELFLVRKSLRERRALHRRLPHHVRPLRFLFPIYEDSRVSRFQLKMGLWLYDRLAGRKQPVGPHLSFSRKALVAEEPCLSSAELKGGFSYGDCGTDDARMVLEVVESAVEAGAVAANYVRVQDWVRDEDRISGAVLRDEASGDEIELKAKIVVNTAGPWVFRLPGLEDRSDQVRLTKGVHLVMPAMQSDSAVLLTARSDGRVFFLIPWYGRTLLGTTDTDYTGDPATVEVDQNDVSYLLDAANSYLEKPWTEDDVLGTFAGLRTLQNEAGVSASKVSREWCIEQPVPGLLSSVGGKYTSARIDAAEISESVFGILGEEARGGKTPMAWHPGTKFEAWFPAAISKGTKLGLDSATAENCARRYGAKVEELFALLKDVPELADRIVPDLPFCRAEVVHTAQREMPLSLVDILRRRIPLLLLSRLPDDVLRDVSMLAGDVLGWDAARRESEVQQVREQKARQFVWSEK